MKYSRLTIAFTVFEYREYSRFSELHLNVRECFRLFIALKESME
jgi:hypothetical protein